MPDAPRWTFLNCSNPDCRLRFPLDLSQHAGKYCPLCGSILQESDERLPQNADREGAPAKRSNRRFVALLDNLRSAQNVGGIFRSADGAGFEKVYLCGISPTPKADRSVSKTALSAEKSLPWVKAPNAIDLAQGLLAEGFRLLALEESPDALNLFSFDLPEDWQKVALIVGNEITGVDPALLQLADRCLQLPMAGQKGSLNVATAFSIAAYELQFGQALGKF